MGKVARFEELRIWQEVRSLVISSYAELPKNVNAGKD